MLPAIGYAMREQNRPCADEPAWTGVEIDFQRANHPLRTAPYLAGLHFEYVSVHALELSVASPDAPSRTYLDALLYVAGENGAAAITDHLGFTHGVKGGPGVGHVTAPPCTAAALDSVCRNIDRIQDHFGARQFYLENLAHFFVLTGEMPEADFFRRVLERTGCGLLLDVTNAYANQINFGLDAREFIQSVVPAASRVQMHLAGGYYDEDFGRYIDSHSEPVPDEVWPLFREALQLGRGKVDAVFIERDWKFPDDSGWRSELQRVREVVEQAEACHG